MSDNVPAWRPCACCLLPPPCLACCAQRHPAQRSATSILAHAATVHENYAHVRLLLVHLKAVGHARPGSAQAAPAGRWIASITGGPSPACSNAEPAQSVPTHGSNPCQPSQPALRIPALNAATDSAQACWQASERAGRRLGKVGAPAAVHLKLRHPALPWVQCHLRRSSTHGRKPHAERQHLGPAGALKSRRRALQLRRRCPVLERV